MSRSTKVDPTFLWTRIIGLPRYVRSDKYCHTEALAEVSILNAFSEIIHYIVAQNDVVGLLKIS